MKSIAQFDKKQLVQATKGTWEIDTHEQSFYVHINTDSRSVFDDSDNLQLFLAIKGDRFDGHNFIKETIEKGICAVCVSETFFNANKKYFLNMKDIKVAILVVKDTTQAYLDIAKFYRKKLGINHNFKVIAITGSCGKTSSKEMLKSVCEEAYGKENVYATKANTNNHIGVPQNILNISNKCQIAILELGTSSPGEIARLANCCRPDIALITVIGHGHLEELKNLEGVAEEKGDIFKFMTKKNWAIIPKLSAGHDILIKKSLTANLNQFASNYDHDADYMGDIIEENLYGSIVTITDNSTFRSIRCQLPFQGKHQLSNAVGVFAVAKVLGINKEKIAKGLERSHNVGMRMKIEQFNEKKLTIINDAYNANFDSMVASLNWLQAILRQEKFSNHSCFLVLGDMLELGGLANELHIKIIKFLRDNFFNNEKISAKIFLIGPQFKASLNEMNLIANRKKIAIFDNSEEAKKVIATELASIEQEKILFLKGSRGMKLELIEDTVNENS